ncbi:hypothetical protein CSV69_01015 [Sporosarcina sp. P26b]|uniref:hypothetical protein n=1 Tax=Sporosarcina TaxID=1569 RepID=UPI000A17B7E9|nr:MULTISPECIES: hypothetical protein [Sporosarcina]ARK20633.1 hypothetical protein SporoP32a_03135 [Sporosarcina ureae]PIC74828.1 hypothetical protein CSV76_02980 [Sporosarcina sp. P17b]PIC97530.1 hypothetical protein CSV69_01015 [Sporosarcina sp. P26b]
MLRSGKVFLLLLLAVVLVGCNQKVEVRTDDAFVSAKKVFELNSKKTNHAVGDIDFYKPPTIRVDEESTSQTIVLTKRHDSFYLTVNPNEKKNSHVYYDVLLTDEPENLVGAQTFSKDEAFGFVAVIEKGEKQVELIANVGGAKVETVTDEANTSAYLEKMMEIARSVQHDDQ